MRVIPFGWLASRGLVISVSVAFVVNYFVTSQPKGITLTLISLPRSVP